MDFLKPSGIIESTFVLILVFLVVSNAFGFSQAMQSIGDLYTSSVRTLQGR